MKKIKCFFGLHDWKAIKVDYYRDVSWCTDYEQMAGAGTRCTNVTYKCVCCHKIKTTVIRGSISITLEDLQ